MLLVIDNYDSFTYNLVQYLGEMGQELKVFRNDALSVGDIEKMNPDREKLTSKRNDPSLRDHSSGANATSRCPVATPRESRATARSISTPPGGRAKSKRDEKGYVRGYDARSGKRLWIFHTIPQAGEFGSETWLKDSSSYTGDTPRKSRLSR